jgi:hypothetical protein
MLVKEKKNEELLRTMEKIKKQKESFWTRSFIGC